MITIPIEIPLLLGFFAAYALWFVAAAKRDIPITIDEATMLWKIHKQRTNCTCRKWQPKTTRKGKVASFKCECGYKYAQKRHIVSRTPKTKTDYKLQTTAAFSPGAIFVSDKLVNTTRTSGENELNAG